MFKRALMVTAITLAASSAHSAVLLSEGFDNISTLTTSGWTTINLSSPVSADTTDWFQGDLTIFTAQSGAADSYLGANYNTATAGGTINNTLVSPSFSTAVAGTVTFFAKAAILAPYFDTISFGIVGSTAPTQVTLTGSWTQYTVNFAAAGAGSTAKFAISYVGNADQSNYIGIDSFTVANATAVPEPSTWLLLGAGLVGVAAAKRRSSAQS